GIDQMGSIAGETLSRRLSMFGVSRYFDEFTRGIVSLQAIVYFAGLAAVAMYVNVTILQRRRWPRTEGSWPMGLHAAVRFVAIVVAMGSAVTLSARARVRADLTAERLYSLSAPTRALLSTLPSDRPVQVQAFISPGMPQPLVQTRENLLGMLQEFEG